MATSARKGQALMELAVGMFVLALVLTTIFAYVHVIVRYLDMQRNLRVTAGRTSLVKAPIKGLQLYGAQASDAVEIDAYPAKYVFGTDSAKIKANASMPQTRIVKIIE